MGCSLQGGGSRVISRGFLFSASHFFFFWNGLVLGSDAEGLGFLFGQARFFFFWNFLCWSHLGQGSHCCHQFHAIGFYFCDVAAVSVAFVASSFKGTNLVWIYKGSTLVHSRALTLCWFQLTSSKTLTSWQTVFSTVAKPLELFCAATAALTFRVMTSNKSSTMLIYWVKGTVVYT